MPLRICCPLGKAAHSVYAGWNILSASESNGIVDGHACFHKQLLSCFTSSYKSRIMIPGCGEALSSRQPFSSLQSWYAQGRFDLRFRGRLSAEAFTVLMKWMRCGRECERANVCRLAMEHSAFFLPEKIATTPYLCSTRRNKAEALPFAGRCTIPAAAGIDTSIWWDAVRTLHYQWSGLWSSPRLTR